MCDVPNLRLLLSPLFHQKHFILIIRIYLCMYTEDAKYYILFLFKNEQILCTCDLLDCILIFVQRANIADTLYPYS